VKVKASNPRLGSRGRPEQSRAAILQAAVREFADQGIAGARTDAIARAAKVNKALLYYYFKDKEALYGAVLDQVFGGLIAHVGEVLSRDLPPQEKILAYAGAHFDYVASHPLYPRIVQGEMMGVGRGRTNHLDWIVKRYFRPLFGRVSEVLKRGQATGEFRPVDPLHFIPSMIAVIVFYFTSAPVMRLMTGKDPMSPERVAARRAAVLDLISAALFRRRGGKSRGARH
jgi:TetR/AcrR family transcriptional regulator